jgi:N12 class adenine-specific DNA methylase
LVRKRGTEPRLTDSRTPRVAQGHAIFSCKENARPVPTFGDRTDTPRTGATASDAIDEMDGPKVRYVRATPRRALLLDT